MKQADALSPKSLRPAVSRTESDVIQLQSDPTRPQDHEPEQAVDEEAAVAELSGGSQEFPDHGEGVASIEEGTFGVAGEGAQQEKEETSQAVQTKGDSWAGNQPPTISPAAVVNHLGSGAPIHDRLRTSMEGSFGEAFTGVTFHTNQRAGELASAFGAHAFTIGEHIAFASGRYKPHTTEGRRLIAHELTHVTQQRRGVSGALLHRGIGTPGDEYEHEADRKADEVVGRGDSAGSPGAGPKGQLKPTQLGQAGVSESAVQLFAGSAAASYASKWALGTNSAYGRFGNDCTNFASQAMEAGGWTMLTGSSYCDDRAKDSVWWFNPGGCVYGVCPWSWCPDVKTINASHTWGGAQNFYNFVKSSGRGTSVGQVYDLVEGDILHMDFSGGGHIGHTMVVTKKTPTNLYFSYHTSDHLDEPFWPDGSNKGILDRNKTAKYYGWNIK